MNVLKEGIMLDPKDKDLVYQCVSNWIVELGEIDATIRKSDIAQLKAYLTKDYDILRLPYKREASAFARRTVFFGSVNEVDYLNDPTGNRRFWTIACESLNHDHNIDMQQVWAEFYELYKKGEQFHLTADEMAMLNDKNKMHEALSVYEEKIRETFEIDGAAGSGTLHFMTCTEISEACGFQFPTNKDLKGIGSAVRRLTGQSLQSNNARRGYYMPVVNFKVTDYQSRHPYHNN
jgi:putative DNA primase/helicase